MTDEFQAWRDALATKQPIAYEKGSPCCGFYRRRFSDRARDISARWEAIAIWRQDDEVRALRQFGRGILGDADQVDELFATCSKNPISEDLYYAVTESGAPWPDDIPEIESARGLGDNSQVPAFELMKGDIQELCRAARAFLMEIGGAPRTKDEADKLANFKTKLTELKTSSEAQRTEEKRPHLEAGRAVDEAWKPVIALAETAAKDLSGPLAAWLRAEQQRQAEEARLAREKALEEVRAAEAARIAAMADAFAKGEPLPEPEPERPAPAAPKPVEKVSVGTRRGVSLRTRTVYEIVYLQEATNFILEKCGSNPPADLVAAVQTAVNKMMKAGVAVPGVVAKEEISA